LFTFYLDSPIEGIISERDNAREAALKIISTAERDGSLPALLRGIADARPSRQDIQTLVSELLAALGSIPAASDGGSHAESGHRCLQAASQPVQ